MTLMKYGCITCSMQPGIELARNYGLMALRFLKWVISYQVKMEKSILSPVRCTHSSR